MTYLLDVNVLLAFRYAKHVHHERVSRWLEARRQLASAYGAAFATLDTGIPGALLIPNVPDNASCVSEPRLMYGCDVAA